MLATTVDIVMLSSSAVSGSCCVAATTRSNLRTRALAITMPLVMVLATFTHHQVLTASFGAVVLALSASLLGRPTPLDVHRSLGGGLMAVLVFVHLGLMRMIDTAAAHEHLAGATQAVHTQMGHLAVEHGSATHLVVALALVGAAAFVAWTAHEVGHMRRARCTGVIVTEFVSMAASVAAMAVGVLLMVHSMHG